MKIDVYQEQYRSGKAYHEPGKIGFGFDPSIIKDVGNAVIDASLNKFENDDSLNSARVEADTMFEADKMLREFKATANPETFEQDMANQRNAIQNLIRDNSKQFKLAKNQRAFSEKMTRSLEENYIGQALTFSYKLQDEHAKDLVKTTMDSFKAQLLAGNSLLTPQAVIQNIKEYSEAIGQRFKVDKQTLDAFVKTQIAETVTSYAYGIVDTDPIAIKNMLLGDSFDKFKASKEEAGTPFTMEDFWTNAELQNEYRSSEYGANWVDIGEYLDYPTRMQLWKVATETATKQEKEKLKQTLMANALTDAEVDMAKEACISQAKLDGTLPAQYRGASTVTALDDPELGSKDVPIKMGEAKKGPLKKGNSFTKQGLDFANGIDGGLRGQGYDTYITSNLRPGDAGSQHATASAVDIQVFKGKDFSLDGSIKAYAEAVKKYSNNMRKGGTLFEVDPTKLDYVKAQLEQMGIDTSFINWEQSAKYGKSAYEENRQHVHFGIDPKADYTKTNAGMGVSYTFSTRFGKMRYQQLRASGKDTKNAYTMAIKDETDILAAQKAYTLLNQVITSKDANGNILDPAQYGTAIVAIENSITGDTKLSDRDRIIALEAVNNLKSNLPKLQEQYNNDKAGFIQENFRTTDPVEVANIQQKLYGIAPNEVQSIPQGQAKTVANQLETMAPEQAIMKINSMSNADIEAVSKYFKDKSKGDLLSYARMASPALQGEIVAALKDWEGVQKYIEQNKGQKNTLLPKSEWKAFAAGMFRSNAILKGYLADVKKQNPQAETKIVNAMTMLYAYKGYAGATSPKNTVDSIAKDLVGYNFNTITVKTPWHGNTTVNISKKDFGGKTEAITYGLEAATRLGLDPTKVQSFAVETAVAANSGSDLLSKTQNAINARETKLRQDLIISSAHLGGSPAGDYVDFVYSDAKGVEADTPLRTKSDNKPMRIYLNDLVKHEQEANKLALSWMRKETITVNKDGITTKHAANKYDYKKSPYVTFTIPTTKSGKNSYMKVSGTYAHPYATWKDAKQAAMEHVLQKYYPWLKETEYRNFKN